MNRYKMRLKKKHLAVFEWYVFAWAKHFGLDKRWDITVDWADVGSGGDKRAEITYRCTSRMAVIALMRDSSDIVPMTERLLAWSACHEAVHLLLAPIADYAEEGAPRCLNLIDIEHEVVHTLTHISMRDHFDDLREGCPIQLPES